MIFILFSCDDFSIKEISEFECTNPVVPYCVKGGVGSEYLWNGNDQYCFSQTSFACQNNPVEYPYVLESDSFLSTSGAGIVDKQFLHDSIVIAQEKWNTIGANVVLIHTATDEINATDDLPEEGVVVGMVANEEDCSDVVDGELAHAFCQPGAGGMETGFQFCTVAVNSKFIDPDVGCVYILWDFSEFEADVGSFEYNFPSLLVHEFGHTLGLDDNRINGSAMHGVFPYETVLDPRLSSDDVEAMLYLYQ